jgi:hypothetical protein
VYRRYNGHLLNLTLFKFPYVEPVKRQEAEKKKYFTGVFRDEAIDNDNDGKFDSLKIYSGVNVEEYGNYKVESRIYDDKDQHIYFFEGNQQLSKGFNEIIVEIPSQKIYEHKVFGYLKLGYISLLKDGKQLEIISPEYESTPYGYDDFSALLPDLVIKNVVKKMILLKSL